MTHDSGSPTSSPEKKALLEAFDTVLKTKADEREAERVAAESRRRASGMSRPLMGISATVLISVGGYLFVERPDWIFPAPPPPESLAVREASLRIAMANAAQHVEHFRQHNRQLPESLAQAGAQGMGIAYDRSGERLPARTARWPEYGSRTTRASRCSRFVGNSFKVISRRGK